MVRKTSIKKKPNKRKSRSKTRSKTRPKKSFSFGKYFDSFDKIKNKNFIKLLDLAKINLGRTPAQINSDYERELEARMGGQKNLDVVEDELHGISTGIEESVIEDIELWKNINKYMYTTFSGNKYTDHNYTFEGFIPKSKVDNLIFNLTNLNKNYFYFCNYAFGKRGVYETNFLKPDEFDKSMNLINRWRGKDNIKIDIKDIKSLDDIHLWKNAQIISPLPFYNIPEIKNTFTEKSEIAYESYTKNGITDDEDKIMCIVIIDPVISRTTLYKDTLKILQS